VDRIGDESIGVREDRTVAYRLIPALSLGSLLALVFVFCLLRKSSPSEPLTSQQWSLLMSFASLTRDQILAASGVMGGNGAYHKHAKLPSGVALAFSYWEKAVFSVPLGNGNRPVVVADYGSSQARNSFSPLRIAVRAVRARLGPDSAILIHR
jgi:hypothetical protein